MSLLLLLRPLKAPVGPQPPSITSFTPIAGPIGTVVVISGSNFTAATDVSFHGTSAISFTVDSAIQITATVPVGTTTGTISVTTAIGTGTSATPFTVTVPVISGQTPHGRKRRQVRIKYEDFQRNPEFLKQFLNLPEFDEQNNAAKAEEAKRIAKREAKMRAKAAAEEARDLARTMEAAAASQATEMKARLDSINKQIMTLLIMAAEDES